GYIIGGSYLVNHPIDITALQQALDALCKRHEALRTRFDKSTGVYRQVVSDQPLIIEQVDIQAADLNGKGIEAQADKMATHRFDLFNDCLLKVTLARISDPVVVKNDSQQYLFSVTMHHLISDGVSIEVFVREFYQLYQGFKNDEPVQLTELPFSYKDYANWQNSLLSGKNTENAGSQSNIRRYWHGKLGSELTPIQLPTDFKRPAIKTHHGATLAFTFDVSRTTNLTAVCQNQGASLFMGLIAITKVLLHRYSGQNDIIVGTPSAGRDHPGLENQIGFYVNMLVLADKVYPQDSFESLLGKVMQTNIEAYDHDSYPYSLLVEELVTDHDASRSPLFDVMLSMTESSEAPPNELSKTFVPFDMDNRSVGASHDLAVLFNHSADTITVNLTYNTDLFKTTTIERMQGHFGEIFNQAIADPTQQIGDMELVTADESAQLLAVKPCDYPKDLLIHQQFETMAERYADKNALILCEEHCNGKTMSYRELNQKANQLAHWLRAEGIAPNDIVAIITRPSFDMIVCILG
ncbi:MAG: condensation domain-containing protein, partial [Psychrosphaera sp.]|nr:condensation domain-containing protein [Psychrosphaera sp.]